MIIRIITPEGGREEFELSEDTVVIGRGKNCDIVLADDHISRKHLEIKNIGGVVYLKDLTLANWVSYNDEKLPKELDVQFFDFAPLLLPGNYRVEIELTKASSDFEQGISQSLKDQLNPHTFTVNADSAVLAEISDVSDEEEEIEEKKPKKRRRTKYVSTKEKKKKNDFYILALIIIGAIGYTVYEFTFNTHVVKPVKLRPIKKVIPPKIEQTDNSQTVSNLVNSGNETSNTPGKKDLLTLLTTPNKCNSTAERVVCKIIFQSSTKNEGVIIDQETMHVFKDFLSQSIGLLGNLNALKELTDQKEVLYKAIAAHNIINPPFLEMLEKQGLKNVEMYLFSNSVSGPQVLKIFDLEISEYRRMSENDYKQSYEALVVRNLGPFVQNLSRFIKEKNQ